MKAHAFVAMPFGVKTDATGASIDFNRVYSEYIAPALAAAGLEAFRADQELRAGDIRADLFQELLVADLVVADLTLPNPNVWYELGVRHALRARGVVLVCGGSGTTAFDLYTDRKLRYRLAGGGPDPATLADDRQALIDMVRATMESWHGRKLSPVYALMPNLQEPDWKSLRIGAVREFWERHEQWQARVQNARRANAIGDLLVLADEAPVAAFRAAAWIEAGTALRSARRYDFALEQLERGLEIEPANLKGLCEQGVCLQRLAMAGLPGYTLERARAHYARALAYFPDNPEIWALLGRVDKDAWCAAWRTPGKLPARARADAAHEDALLRAAIASYREGYRRNQGHYYSGINALTLMHLYRELTGDTQYERAAATMAGAVRFAAECESQTEQLYWARATLGDVEVLVGSPDSVTAAFKEALVKSDENWFALDSCRAQLQLLQLLDFKAANVAAGIAVFDRALARAAKPTDWQPRHVFLFSGHMIDTPQRPTPRFPPDQEPVAAARIAQALEQLGAGAEDLALTQGACGGDLLFTEACLARGVNVQWLQPFDEPRFIEESVVRCGESWRRRYLDARARLAAPPRAAAAVLGPPPLGTDEGYAYERCNLWLLYTALAACVDKVRFICLWNGGGGDGPGGTAHMYEEVKRRTGQVTWIDTRQAW